MTKILVLIVVSLAACFGSARAQQVCRWDVCEDTTDVIFEASEGLSAASSSDIAEIARKTWSNDGYSRLVIRNSTDSGRTWKQLFTQGKSWGEQWYSIAHPSSNSYFVTGDSLFTVAPSLFRHHAFLLLSSDGGSSWRYQYWDTNTVLKCVTMQNSNHGIAQLGHLGNVHDSLPNLIPTELLVTQDGWKTWSSTPLPFRGAQQLFCFSPGVYGAVTYKGYIDQKHYSQYWKTTDAGKHWDSISVFPYVQDVCFINEYQAWGAATDWSKPTSKSLIVNSTDGGVTWATQLDSNMSPIGWPDGLSQIAFADSLHGFAVGHRILETSDGGNTWNANKPPFEVLTRDGAGNGTGGALNGLIMPSPSLAFYVCGGPILRYTGQHRLDAPVLRPHEYGPIPIVPTTISWSRVKGAELYHVQLAVSPGEFGAMSVLFDVVELDTIVHDTFFAFTPRPKQNYYARVQAITEGNNSDWRWNWDWDGLGIYFATIRRAGAALPPKIITPVDLSHTSNNDVKVVWTSVPGAVLYRLRAYCNDGWNLTHDFTTADTFALLPGLTYKARYDINVIAMLSDDTTDGVGTSVFIDVMAGVQSVTGEGNLQVFPNPAHDVIHVALDDEMRSTEFKLYDVLGHVQHVEAIREASGVRIDVRALPAGLYTLVMPGSQRISKRIVVTH